MYRVRFWAVTGDGPIDLGGSERFGAAFGGAAPQQNSIVYMRNLLGWLRLGWLKIP